MSSSLGWADFVERVVSESVRVSQTVTGILICVGCVAPILLSTTPSSPLDPFSNSDPNSGAEVFVDQEGNVGPGLRASRIWFRMLREQTRARV